MRNDDENNTDGNNSIGGDYGQLQAEIIQLQETNKHLEITGKVFIHYLCVQGGDDWFKKEELDEIHLTYLRAAHAKY